MQPVGPQPKESRRPRPSRRARKCLSSQRQERRPRSVRRGKVVAASRKQSRQPPASSVHRVRRPLEKLGRKQTESKMVGLVGQPKKLPRAIVSPRCRRRSSPLCADLPCLPLGRASPHAAAFPPCAALPFFLRLPPHAPDLPQAPRCRDLLAAFLGAALCAAVDDPRRWRGSGDGRPRFGHGPAACASGRGLRRGLAIPRPAVTPTASTAGLRVELAR